MLLGAGARRAIAIGSPFLYLLQMRGEAALDTPRSLVSFPFHSHPGLSFEETWNEYAAYLRSLPGYDEITVCLYPDDYERDDVRAYFEDHGLAVATNGTREDPRFLERFYDLVAAHSDVTSNRVSTALVFGAAMGRRAFLGGPVPGISVHQTAGAWEDEADRAAEYERRTYPDLVAGLEPDAARAFGRSQLGEQSMRRPNELRRILGWSGPKRVAARALAGVSALRRRVKRL